MFVTNTARSQLFCQSRDKQTAVVCASLTWLADTGHRLYPRLICLAWLFCSLCVFFVCLYIQVVPIFLFLKLRMTYKYSKEFLNMFKGILNYFTSWSPARTPKLVFFEGKPKVSLRESLTFNLAFWKLKKMKTNTPREMISSYTDRKQRPKNY